MEDNKVIEMNKEMKNDGEQNEEKKIPVLDFVRKYNSMTSDKAKKTYIQRIVTNII